jgi:hypothetical protein
MYQDVPEGDDVSVVTDLLKDARFITMDTGESFPDNPEFSLDGAAKQFIRRIAIECTARDETLHGFPGLDDVMKMGEDLSLHTEESFHREHAS